MNIKKTFFNLLRVALSVLTLGFLLHEVGGNKVLDVLRQADLLLLGLAWLLFMLGVVVRTFRWRALLNGLGLFPPFGQLLKLYLVGGFFNSFLPTGFGGDVVRVLELAQGEKRAAAAGTVLVDRMTGFLSLMALGLLVLPFTSGLQPWLVGLFAFISGSCLLAGFLVLEGRLLRRLTAWLPQSLSLAGQGKLAQLYAAVTGAGTRAVAMAFLLSTLFNLLNIAIHWLCGLAVGVTVSWTFYFVATPLLALALLIPISVGGLGARDWVAQPLFASMNVSDALAAGMSLSVYIVTAAAGLVGGLIYLWQGVQGTFARENQKPSAES